mgnify:CR=1 FL=1
MFFRFFRGYSPLLTILLPLLTILLWINALLTPQAAYSIPFTVMPLSAPLFNIMAEHRWLSSILALVMILIQGYVLLLFERRFSLLPKRGFLPSFFFIILSCAIPSFQVLHPALIANFFLIAAMYRIFSSFKQMGLSYTFFDAALIISVGSLFYHGFLPLLLFLFVAHPALRPFNMREWLFVIIGALVPYVFLFSWCFLTDRIEQITILASVFGFTASTIAQIPLYFSAFFLFIALLTLFSIIYVLNKIGQMKIQIRSYFVVLCWLVILLLIFFISFQSIGPEIMYLLFFPLSLLLSYYFYHFRVYWMGELSIIVLFLFVFFFRFTAFFIDLYNSVMSLWF